MAQSIALEQDSTSDAEVGYRHLTYEAADSHLQGGIALYNWDDRIASAVARCAVETAGRDEGGGIRCVHTAGGLGSWVAGRCREHLAHTAAILGRVVPESGAVARGALVLDYDGWVRRMVAVDDELEAAEAAAAAGRQRRGRQTRNSQREQHVRCVSLDAAQLALLRQTALGTL